MGRGSGEALLDAPVKNRSNKKSGKRELTGAERYEKFRDEHLKVLYLTDDKSVSEAASYIRKLDPKIISVDFETASKRGHFGSFNGSLRTIQLGFHEPERGIGPLQVIIDCHRCSPRPFLPMLRTRNSEKQIHYMDFEQEWAMLHLGISIGQVYDTCIAGQVIQKKLKSMPLEEAQKLVPGWEPHNNKLATLTERYLGLELPKENQASDWGQESLTPDQLVYAAMDVATLPALTEKLKEMAEKVGVTEDIDRRIAWVRGKIAERVEKAKAAQSDDSKRLVRAMKRARTTEELDRVLHVSRQMTILAENGPELQELYRERKKELAA